MLVVLPVAARLTASLMATSHRKDDDQKDGNADGEDGTRGQGGYRQNGQSIGTVCGGGWILFIYSLLRRDTDTQSEGIGLEQSPELDQDQCGESVCGGY